MRTKPNPNPLPERCPRCKTTMWYALEDAGDYTCLMCGEMWYTRVGAPLEYTYNWRLGERRWSQSNSRSRTLPR